MGIGITEEQRELAQAVRGWLARAVPPEEIRKLLDADVADASAVSVARPGYWEGLAEQGLLSVHLPEKYGGGGGRLLDLAVVLEEAGRGVLPGPYLASVLASAVLQSAVASDSSAVASDSSAAASDSAGVPDSAAAPGSSDVPRSAAAGAAGAAGAGEPVLRDLASGRRVGAVALGTGTLTAVEHGDGHLLDGTAPPVLSGADADLLLLPAESATGTLWFAVDATAEGLAVRPHRGVDPTRPTAEVRADGVLVPAERLVRTDTTHVRDLAAVLLSAEACGIASRALDTAAEYAKVREQFGRPIGQFQAVKHLCADMLVRVERARALVWDAARAAEEPETGPDARSLAAALAASEALDAAYGCAKDCIQILGGIGFTWEHDAHLYLRRAVVARQLLGPGDAHRLRALRLAEGGARRELVLELPAEAADHRAEARETVAAARGLDPKAARRVLAPTGYAAPHLPAPYGLGASPVQQLAIQKELREQGVRLSDLGIATWVVPSLIAHGTAQQQDRYLLPTLRGELQWCQLFSEPGAGSDLASLRTRAERTAEGWRINGQKVWTSAARSADHGILLARTDPDVPKHQGLSYFLVDMKNTEGIDIRPLKEITGDSLFNEVYFDNALLPADAVVGEIGDGWRVARNTLGNERVHMADQMTFDTGLEALIDRSGELDGTYRARIGALAAEAHALACIGLRTTLRQVSGLEPGAGASVRKLVQTTHQQKVAELALELLGPAGATAEGAAERAVHGFLMSRCLTIAGGTTQVQLNVVAERILGLPRD